MVAHQEVAINGNGHLPVVQSRLSTLTPKARLFKHINQDIPNNDFGLPEYYYRADILPSDLLDLPADEQASYLDAATIELDYLQGFPATQLGEPFWGQLPHEPSEAYRAFTAYLDLPSRDIVAAASKHQAAASIRQLHLLKTELGIADDKGDQLVEMAYTYYWHVRARAYDVFKVVSHNKQREQRLMTAENQHFQIASSYITCATDYLNTVFQDPDSNGLKPRDAMDLLVKMIQVQRLSSGVAPFSNTKGDSSVPQNTTLEVILRTIAQQMNGGAAQNNGGGRAEQDLQDLTKKLLSGDTNDLAKAQELIIRVSGSSEGRTRNLSPTDGEGHL